MNNRVLASIVLVELVTGIYFRWTLPGLWGPWALVAVLFLVAGTFGAWGRLETYVGRRRHLTTARLMRSARDPWRSYDPPTVEKAVRPATAALQPKG